MVVCDSTILILYDHQQFGTMVPVQSMNFLPTPPISRNFVVAFSTCSWSSLRSLKQVASSWRSSRRCGHELLEGAAPTSCCWWSCRARSFGLRESIPKVKWRRKAPASAPWIFLAASNARPVCSWTFDPKDSMSRLHQKNWSLKVPHMLHAAEKRTCNSCCSSRAGQVS